MILDALQEFLRDNAARRCWLVGFLCTMVFTGASMERGVCAADEGIRVGSFKQEVGHLFGEQEGEVLAEVDWVVALPEGGICAAGKDGLAVYSEGKWSRLDISPEKPIHPLRLEGHLQVLAGDTLYRIEGDKARKSGTSDQGKVPHDAAVPFRTAGGDRLTLFVTDGDLVMWGGNEWKVYCHLPENATVRRVAESRSGEIALACAEGVFVLRKNGNWHSVIPEEGKRKWILYDVRDVAYDRIGRLWVASPYGVACRGETGWKLYTGKEGLPYDDFTCVVPGEEGVVWFGTRIGAVRFDGGTWEYRQGKRWIPGDEIRDLFVDAAGNAWLATNKGVGWIERVPMTLARKAAFYENEIDLRHRRTPFGFVLEVALKRPGDKSEWTNHDSDNDGLWTSMYGAGECFAYAVTREPEAKERADKAFRALRFLSEVTQGGTHPAPPGFPARSILPTSGPNPNDPSGGPEHDRRKRERDDALWKILYPRWPVSEDGKWYWKTDTSSDELDGHYFFYALYYDLVAETEEERDAVRKVVMAITDHLLDHDYNLVDWDGTPTRWAHFGPKDLNFDLAWWEERGLNSLSILSYLKVAEHVSGGAERYRQAYDELIREHGYAQNLMVPKIHWGPGTGNQSDDEMAFMNYYNLLRYETDPELRSKYAYSLHLYWELVAPELNPLFNYIAKASLEGIRYGDVSEHAPLPNPGKECLQEALDTLKRYPLNLVRWELRNSHRTDILPVPAQLGVPDQPPRRGYRTNGKVLPIDERFVQHWNHDPWELDYRGNGMELADGAAFLLPYYMGLYHGYILEDER